MLRTWATYDWRDEISLDHVSHLDLIVVTTLNDTYEIVVLSPATGDVLVRGGRVWPASLRLVSPGARWGAVCSKSGASIWAFGSNSSSAAVGQFSPAACVPSASFGVRKIPRPGEFPAADPVIRQTVRHEILARRDNQRDTPASSLDAQRVDRG